MTTSPDLPPGWTKACDWAAAYCRQMFNKDWQDDSIAAEYMAARNGYLAAFEGERTLRLQAQHERDAVVDELAEAQHAVETRKEHCYRTLKGAAERFFLSEGMAEALGYRVIAVYERVTSPETPAECAYCHGNDRNMPCAYPGEGKPGCLRDKRLVAETPAEHYTVAEAWRIATTLAHNICTQESDRINADDGPPEAMHALTVVATRIRGWLEPGDQLTGLLAEGTGRPPSVKTTAKRTDTQRLDGLEALTAQGDCPGVINDDNGHWAVSGSGMQSVSAGPEPVDTSTAFFVPACLWRNSIREAIDDYLDDGDDDDNEIHHAG